MHYVPEDSLEHVIDDEEIADDESGESSRKEDEVLLRAYLTSGEKFDLRKVDIENAHKEFYGAILEDGEAENPSPHGLRVTAHCVMC